MASTSKTASKEHDALVLEIFPEEDYMNNLKQLCDSIRTVEVPGLKWTEKEAIEEVGFGIAKARMQCIIPTSLPTDVVIGKVKAVPGVKSVEFGSLSDTV